MQVFAKAIAGGDEKKLFEMMEAGQVISSEVLPKVAEEFKKAARNGDALKKSMQSNRAEMNRMSNNWKTMKDTFYTSGFSKAMVFLYQSLNKAMEAMEPMIPGFAKFFRLFTIGALLPFNLFVAAIKDLQKIFPSVDSEALNLGLSITGVALGFGAAAAAVLYFRKALMMLSGMSAAKWLFDKITGGGDKGGSGKGSGLGKKIGKWALPGLGATYAAAKTPMGAAALGTTALAGAATYGAISLDQNMRRSMWEGTLNRYNSSDMRPAGGQWGATTDVNVKVNEGNLKGLIEVEVVKHNKNNLNEIIMNTPD